MELWLQRYPWIPTALAALIGAYLCARIVNTLTGSALAPKPALLQQSVGASPQTAPQVQRFELNAARLAKVFDVPLPQAAPEGETAQPMVQKADWQSNPTKSGLHAALIGTAVTIPSRYSLCQLTNSDTNESFVYAIGDTFMGTRIYDIEQDRVLIDNDGKNEYIDMGGAGMGLGVTPMIAPMQPSQSADVKQLSENQYVVAKATINDALTDLSKLATQARIVPSFKNGVANGFKLFSIVPDSLYAKIGVQNGDVIRRINGYEMNSPDKALEIYSKLRDANRIEIELERRGETIRKSYSIE